MVTNENLCELVPNIDVTTPWCLFWCWEVLHEGDCCSPLLPLRCTSSLLNRWVMWQQPTWQRRPACLTLTTCLRGRQQDLAYSSTRQLSAKALHRIRWRICVSVSAELKNNKSFQVYLTLLSWRDGLQFKSIHFGKKIIECLLTVEISFMVTSL